MTTDSESSGERPDQQRPRRRNRRQFDDVGKEFRTEPAGTAATELELANEELGDALESRRQTTWGLCDEVAFLRLLARRSRLLGSGDDDAAWSVVWEQPPHEVLAAIQNEAATYDRAIAEWLPATAKFAESADAAELAEVVDQKKKNYARSLRETRHRRAVNARRRPHVSALRNILRLAARLLPTFARAAADGRLEAAQTAAGARAVFALGVEAGRQSVMISGADDFERAIADRQREAAPAKRPRISCPEWRCSTRISRWRI